MDKNTHCTQCGATSPPDARFCEQCGAPIRDALQQPSEPLTPRQPVLKRLNRRYVTYLLVGALVVSAYAAAPYFMEIVALAGTGSTSDINSHFQNSTKSWTVVKPFQRTVLYGADAYVGNVRIDGWGIHNIEVFPRSSESSAWSFQQARIIQFESQGIPQNYTRVDGAQWVGYSNSTKNYVAVDVWGYFEPTDSSAVIIEQSEYPL